MGLPIIGHPVRAGFPVVVYDIDPAKREMVAGKGATFVTDSREVAAQGNQTMAWAEDDMKIVQDMAAEAGIGLPQSALNREVCRVLKPRRYRLGEYGL